MRRRMRRRLRSKRSGRQFKKEKRGRPKKKLRMKSKIQMREILVHGGIFRVVLLVQPPQMNHLVI